MLYWIYLQKIAELLGLNASVSSIDLYLQIHSVFKNYNTVNILQIAKNSYFQFKKNSRLKYINNNLKIYAYSAVQPSDYLVDYIGLRRLVLGLRRELKWDLFEIYYANLFKQWEDVKILSIFKEEFNIYTYHLQKTTREEKDDIL